MFTIVQLKPSRGDSLTALLSDGRSVKVPASQNWGSVLSKEEIVDVGGTLYHKSLVKEKKPKDYGLCRDLTGYDPKAELAKIRELVSNQFQEVMGRRFYSYDEFEEVVSYCMEACIRRHVYEKYSPACPGTYSGYLKTIVFNLLRDYRRKQYTDTTLNCFSLNKIMSGDGSQSGDAAEYIDFVEAFGVDVCEQVEHKILIEKLNACVTRLDKEGTGLPGFSYADLFKLMVNGEPLDDYLKSSRFPRKLLDQYVYDFKEQLKEEVYGVWMVA